MNEYYVLTCDSEILCIFQSLQACLTWKPEQQLYGELVILRVRQSEEGPCKIQKIPVAKEVYNKSI